ncbi:MAG: VOC family protein [Actinomycetes bacterium]
MAKTVQVVFDCADPSAMAQFWADALGYVEQPPPPGYETWPDLLREIGVPEDQWNSRSAVVDPDGAGPRVFFQQVPEGKTVKNRVHLDVRVGGDPRDADHRAKVDAEATRLEGRSAARAWVVDENGEYCVVLRDPEGNEFCVT